MPYVWPRVACKSRGEPVKLSDLPAHAQAHARVQLGPNSPLRAGPVRAKPVQREAAEQRKVIAWADDPLTRAVFPCLWLLFHVANQGAGRSARQGAYLKAQGVRRGVPDLWMPVGNGTYCGLVIELKAGKGGASVEQVEWLELLTSQGWDARVCKGADSAISAIKEYLDHARLSSGSG